MIDGQILLEEWRTLPTEKREVLGFSETLSPEELASPIPERSTSDITFQPKTPLGKKLWELRQKAIADRTPLQTWGELKDEIAQRRGEND